MPTENQIVALTLIADGKVRQHRFGYGAWRIVGAHPSVVGRVVSLGWAKWGRMDGDDMPIALTDDGTAVLAESKQAKTSSEDR